MKLIDVNNAINFILSSLIDHIIQSNVGFSFHHFVGILGYYTSS